MDTPAAAQQAVVAMAGVLTDGAIRADFAENRATNRAPRYYRARVLPAP